jgi:hypothetical protein
MEFKTLLTKPKIMALSGIIAMGCKLVMSGILAVILNLCITNEFFSWEFFFLLFISYPMVALIVDVILYLNKDKIWTTLPNNVPREWETTSEQLLTYTKNLPKIRLMRFLNCCVLILWMPLDFLSLSIFIGFFIGSFFDVVWVNIFKLKQPVLFYNLFNLGPTDLVILFLVVYWDELHKQVKILIDF